MTYNVFGETLNLALSIAPVPRHWTIPLALTGHVRQSCRTWLIHLLRRRFQLRLGRRPTEAFT